MDNRYPLTWPSLWPRTPSQKRERALFEVSFAVARDALLDELRLMKAHNVIISTNIQLRRDGLPYASFKEPEDPGVAVYFQIKRKPYALACDRWNRVKDNLRAIGLHIAAMRGIERWGVGSLEQAFTGYQALPSSEEREWWVVLGVRPNASMEEIKIAYREKAALHHPDRQGSHESMVALNRAWEKARARIL